jgi:hypothetical protein
MATGHAAAGRGPEGKKRVKDPDKGVRREGEPELETYSPYKRSGRSPVACIAK